MWGVSFHTAKWVLVIMTGLSWGIPFFLTFYIIADVPAGLVQTVWKRAMHSDKPKIIDIGNLLGQDTETALEKKEIERNKYRIFCSRLGIRTNYDELETKGNNLMYVCIGMGVVMLLLGLMQDVPFLVLFGAVMVPLGVVMKRSPFMQIDSKIKELDKAIIFEIPIFINNIRVMNTKITFEKALESYLSHAGALRRDLILTIASLKNKTTVRALIDMANRMQRGQKLEEVSSMVDLMKSMYSGTNVERCCINLELLANQINEIHVKPYIMSKRDKKITFMQVAVGVSVILVFLMYSSPMIIEMVMIAAELNA